MLTLPEDLLLLTSRDDENHAHVSGEALSAGLVAAALMDLAIQNRIDSDLKSVWVTDDSLTGEASLDGVLTQLSGARFNFEAAELIERLTSLSQTIRHAALARLQDRGIVKLKRNLFSLVTGNERCSIIDQQPVDELKAELSKILLSDDFPSPRDVCLISLAQTLGLIEHIVPEANQGQAQRRLAAFAKMDLIGGSIGACLDLMFEKLAIAYQSFPRC